MFTKGISVSVCALNVKISRPTNLGEKAKPSAAVLFRNPDSVVSDFDDDATLKMFVL